MLIKNTLLTLIIILLVALISMKCEEPAVEELGSEEPVPVVVEEPLPDLTLPATPPDVPPVIAF